MKKFKRKLQLLSLILMAGLLFSSVTIPVRAFIQKDGTVNEAVILRQDADSSSSQVMELTSGQEVRINNELTGADGAKWYQLFVNDTTLGYVPASTVTVSQGSGSSGGGTATEPQQPGNTTTQTVTERVGTVTADTAIRVRKEATTSSEQIASMESGDTFEVLSDVTASDGYVWHEVNFDDNGTAVHGYVRSDLVSVETITTEIEVPAEPTATQEPAAEETAPYTISSQVNAEGTTVWYLRDTQTGEAREISSLLNAQKEESSGGSGVYKAVIVVMLILVILAAGAATFFYFRWQQAEDFIDEIRMKQRQKKSSQGPVRVAPEKQPVSKPVSQSVAKPTSKPVSQPVPKPVSRPVSRPVVQETPKPVSQPIPKPVSQPVQDTLPNTQDIVKATRQELQNKQNAAAAGSQSGSWRSKNFLTDDDDLEFDFLDMDDK